VKKALVVLLMSSAVTVFTGIPVGSTPQGKVRLAGKPAKTPDMVSIESGENLKFLITPEAFPETERAKIDGKVVLEDGTPLSGLAITLFPYRQDEAHIVFGVDKGTMSLFNPKVRSAADGTFSLVVGPIWKREITRFACGLMVQNKPDRPFDVTVLLFEGDAGPVVFDVTAPQREYHLGTVVIPVASPVLKK